MKKSVLSGVSNLRLFIRWVIFSMLVGILVGVVGVAFHYAIELATEFRIENPNIIFFLPLGGLFIILLYKITGMEKDRGTNLVLVAVREAGKLSLRAAPLIFISTVVTHLFGGSSGREGAALQIGGSMSAKLGTFMGLSPNDKSIITMCGMSAAFAALFGSPVTAVVFAMEVVSVGVMRYTAIVPCCVASATGFCIALYFGIKPTLFNITDMPPVDLTAMVHAAAMGVLCALVSILFCVALGGASKLYEKYIPNRYLRAAIGGVIVIALSFAIGSFDYNGAGMEVIERALAGEAKSEAFLMKIVFTALTLGAGFRGGEIVPVLFTGATFGNVVGKFLGMSPSFGAALGMTSIFCGVTNCPLTAIILGAEIFGGGGLLFFALSCAVSYMLSGYFGLYSEQKILYSKTNLERIDKNVTH